MLHLSVGDLLYTLIDIMASYKKPQLFINNLKLRQTSACLRRKKDVSGISCNIFPVLNFAKFR